MPHFPAQYQNRFENMLAVAAAKWYGGSWHLADFNTRAALESLQEAPVAAPGVALVLEDLGNPEGITGTSFSAAVVSGAAALVKQAKPELSAADLQTTLRDMSQTFALENASDAGAYSEPDTLFLYLP